MRITLNLNSVNDYKTFLKIKSLPVYRFSGRDAIVPDEYASLIGAGPAEIFHTEYQPKPFLFDYQRDIAKLAIRKKKFCVFAECGYGKDLIYKEYIRHVDSVLPQNKSILMVCPLMVVKQAMSEAKRFYGDELKFEYVPAKDLPKWLYKGGRIGITNFEAIGEDLPRGRLGCLVIDESSTLKSAYGAWGTRLIEMGKGLEWKLAGTGTPAPNDRIEFANHAVLMDQYPTVNSFLARFFINRGETSNRWELKAHSLKAFYRSLSHWSIFLSNPAVYGWKDNCSTIPPINISIERIELTQEQMSAAQKSSGDLFGSLGGIGSRAVIGKIAKGIGYESNKPQYIVDLCRSFGDESRIVWCKYNAEQDRLAEMMPEAISLSGDTDYEDRVRMIEDFQNGKVKTIISKPKCMGFGLNLQIATRHVFSTCQDSYEEFHQAVKRSNRIGSTQPLGVHIPVTDIEYPMVQTVLEKAKRIKQDTAEQEALFKEVFANAF